MIFPLKPPSIDEFPIFQIIPRGKSPTNSQVTTSPSALAALAALAAALPLHPLDCSDQASQTPAWRLGVRDAVIFLVADVKSFPDTQV
jgi:hypothetical protein